MEKYKWKRTSHTERLGTFQLLRVVFGYINQAGSQAALIYVYLNTLLACQFFQTALKFTNEIVFNLLDACKESSIAYFAQMSANAVKWVNLYLGHELKYWKAVNTAAGAANHEALLDLKNDLATWATAKTGRIT
jgi:hypothetical protein